MDAGFFKGTSTDQDNRFVDKNKKLMKTMKFGEGLDKKVDMSRVDMEIIRPWINKTITDYLGYEDDVLFEFICNQLDDPMPDGRQMQMNVTGFLGVKNAREFMQKLWELLASAMDDICGIPEELKEQKKEQIRVKQEEQGRINETLKTHQNMIQEAIAKIKVNAAAAAINIRNLSSEHLEKPSVRGGRLTVGLSRSRSPRNVKKANKGTKDSEAGNAQPKASDRSGEMDEAKPGGPKTSRMDDDRRRKESSHGRNRIRNPSPRKDRRRSREQSLHRKSSPRRRSRSRDSPKRGLSRRRSPSPRHSKASPSRHRTHPSRQQRSLSPGGHGPHLSRHRPSRDDNKRRALPDVIGDTPSKRSQGRSESSGSQRMRSRSRSSSAENVRDGKTSAEKLSVFQHRNYRSHRGGRRSSPEDAGASPKPTNPRGSRNGHKKSFSPALAARNDFSPKHKRSPRYSSSIAHRDYAPSPRQSQPPEGDIYPKLEPVFPSGRLSPRLRHSRSQRRSLSFSPGRRGKSQQQWVNERRRGVSPQSSRCDYNKVLPHLSEGPPQTSIRRSRNVSPGYRGDWGTTSKWDGIESRQRSPRGLSEYERRARSPLLERQRVSPFPDRYMGQHEARWPLSPRRDLRNTEGEFRAHVVAPRYEQPREDFDRGGVNAFNRGISHHRQRHGNSPFRRTVPYESGVREPVVEYFTDLPHARGVPPGVGPRSPIMDRQSHAFIRTSGIQPRDDYEPRGVHRADKYPMHNLDRVGGNYDPPGDKYDPRFERRGNSRDRVRDGYEPRVDRFDPHSGRQPSDIVRTRTNLRDKGNFNSRSGNYDSPPREDGNVASRFNRVDDSQRYLNIQSRSRSSHRSKSPKRSMSPSAPRSPSGPRSPSHPNSPQWTDRKAWKEENVQDLGRDRRGAIALRKGGLPANKERTERETLDYKSKYRHAQQREGSRSRSLKRGRSTASSSPDGVSRSSNQARSISGDIDRQGTSVEPYKDHGKEEDDFVDRRNERRANRSLSPSSPPAKRTKANDEDGAISAEGSEVEVSSKKKKKKKEKKKKRKKHKKHKKHKHKRSQEDENEDDSNTDRETQDDEQTSHSPQSQLNVLENEREFELREKAMLSLKTSK